jgi:tellurite resistance protein TehA-like permease
MNNFEDYIWRVYGLLIAIIAFIMLVVVQIDCIVKIYKMYKINKINKKRLAMRKNKIEKQL